MATPISTSRAAAWLGLGFLALFSGAACSQDLASACENIGDKLESLSCLGGVTKAQAVETCKQRPANTNNPADCEPKLVDLLTCLDSSSTICSDSDGGVLSSPDCLEEATAAASSCVAKPQDEEITSSTTSTTGAGGSGGEDGGGGEGGS